MPQGFRIRGYRRSISTVARNERVSKPRRRPNSSMELGAQRWRFLTRWNPNSVRIKLRPCGTGTSPWLLTGAFQRDGSAPPFWNSRSADRAEQDGWDSGTNSAVGVWNRWYGTGTRCHLWHRVRGMLGGTFATRITVKTRSGGHSTTEQVQTQMLLAGVLNRWVAGVAERLHRARNMGRTRWNEPSLI